MARHSRTTSRATPGLSLLEAARYRSLCAATSLRNLMLPGCAFVPPPRPQRISLPLGRTILDVE